MNTIEVIALARKHVNNNPAYRDSAMQCLKDAEFMQAAGYPVTARNRAVVSLQHSIGVFHEDYKKVNPKL